MRLRDTLLTPLGILLLASGCGGSDAPRDDSPPGAPEPPAHDRAARAVVYRALRELGDPSRRDAAAARLASAPPDETPLLCDAFSRMDDPAAAGALAGVLARRRDPAAIPSLVRRLPRGEPAVREALASFSGEDLGPDPVEWMDWWLQAYPLPAETKDEIVRAFAAQPEQDRLQAVLDLAGLFHRTQFRVQTDVHRRNEGSITYSAEVEDMESWERKRVGLVLLEAALGDPSPSVCRGAARLCMNLGRAALPLLTHELANPDPDRRLVAAQSLGRMGVRQAAAPLITALADPNGRVASEAASSLTLLGDDGAREALGRAAGLLDERRPAALAALAALGDAGAFDALLLLLRDPSRAEGTARNLGILAQARYRALAAAGRPDFEPWLARHRLRAGPDAFSRDPAAWRRWWDLEGRPPTR